MAHNLLVTRRADKGEARPSALARHLKERVLPPLYWQAMLKGRQWLAQPEMTT